MGGPSGAACTCPGPFTGCRYASTRQTHDQRTCTLSARCREDDCGPHRVLSLYGHPRSVIPGLRIRPGPSRHGVLDVSVLRSHHHGRPPVPTGPGTRIRARHLLAAPGRVRASARVVDPLVYSWVWASFRPLARHRAPWRAWSSPSSPCATNSRATPRSSPQAFLLAFGVVYRVNHPEKRWLTAVMAAAFAAAIALPLLGLLARSSGA